MQLFLAVAIGYCFASRKDRGSRGTLKVTKFRGKYETLAFCFEIS
jgi:hypothetical protein